MRKKGGIYIVIAVFTVVLLVVLQNNKPKGVDWFPCYVPNHKIAYGTVVLNDVIQRVFPDKIQHVGIPPFEFLKESTTAEGNDRMMKFFFPPVGRNFIEPREKPTHWNRNSRE